MAFVQPMTPESSACVRWSAVRMALRFDMGRSLAALNASCQAPLNPRTPTLRTMPFMSTGARIRQLRRKHGMSQDQLGALCDVTKGAVSQWESDATLPTIENLLALRNKLTFSLDWLLTGNGSPGEDAREDALLGLFRHADTRGQTTILRVAEQESTYDIGAQSSADKVA